MKKFSHAEFLILSIVYFPFCFYQTEGTLKRNKTKPEKIVDGYIQQQQQFDNPIESLTP